VRTQADKIAKTQAELKEKNEQIIALKSEKLSLLSGKENEIKKLESDRREKTKNAEALKKQSKQLSAQLQEKQRQRRELDAAIQRAIKAEIAEKVKNIVEDILGEKAEARYYGRKLTPQFVRDLSWGTQSEVTFVRTEDGVELASVMYNAPVNDSDTQAESAIRGTTTFTTTQRPDIVLRLTKRQKDIQYTFLFDAKYRIADGKKDGQDVPPVDAIDQMHRYRDAIYYVDQANGKPKREIIGGYVLFPGNYTKEEYEQSYYHQSAEKVGIGAFPLRPSVQGDLLVEPNNSEQALREQIEAWLRSKRMLSDLYKKAIPQHGL
jgi:hypothetical protein